MIIETSYEITVLNFQYNRKYKALALKTATITLMKSYFPLCFFCKGEKLTCVRERKEKKS